MDARINVFRIDDPSLIGKNVSSEIRNAIEHCKISIPILSENFASSHWCLDELAQIVECKKTKGQEMLPIFYKVKPSDVKDLLNSFGGNMRQQKKLFKRSKYKQWKQVLKEVGSSKGWESGKIANGHEGVLVKQIVKKVLRLLMNPQTHDRPITIH
ncbi:protein PHLOEM PROTEIN 2-LIKE A8 [Eucalyptus grandis]|uniref:protein PHLOEM PROTEIN 2-LIKE A8 n=1 Tax=Eucalyptus grandis TaxID=71139 RepID=UPI00192E84C6|nr:protein PHLOEM PROTEIN 2-LIKE A8 [Eucalyptus grandis]